MSYRARAFYLLHGFFSFALLLTATSVSSEERQTDPKALIRKLADVAKSLNFSGTFVYTHNNSMQGMRVYHLTDEGNERERLVSLNGVPREIVRENQLVHRFFVESNTLVVDHRYRNPFSPFVDVEQALGHGAYAFSLQGKDRVAGRECDVVSVISNDRLRYSHRLCVDCDTGLLLQSITVDENNKPVEQWMFTELDTDMTVTSKHVLPSFNAEKFSGNLVVEEKNLSLDAENVAWQIAEIPKGFSLQYQQTRQIGKNEKPVAHLMYSDGLATISVYVESNYVGKPFEGISAMGGIHAYGRFKEGLQITAVGEVPRELVELIGDSLQAKPTE